MEGGIDYRKLNTATRNDHFPLPFIDKMLDRLAGHPHFCFLDGYSGYIPKVHDVHIFRFGRRSYGDLHG